MDEADVDKDVNILIVVNDVNEVEALDDLKVDDALVEEEVNGVKVVTFVLTNKRILI